MGCWSHRRPHVEVRPEQKWDYIVSSPWGIARLDALTRLTLHSPEPQRLQVHLVFDTLRILLSLVFPLSIDGRLRRRYLYSR